MVAESGCDEVEHEYPINRSSFQCFEHVFEFARVTAAGLQDEFARVGRRQIWSVADPSVRVRLSAHVTQRRIRALSL